MMQQLLLLWTTAWRDACGCVWISVCRCCGCFACSWPSNRHFTPANITSAHVTNNKQQAKQTCNNCSKYSIKLPHCRKGKCISENVHAFLSDSSNVLLYEWKCNFTL